jgi:hypothetical protein
LKQKDNNNILNLKEMKNKTTISRRKFIDTSVKATLLSSVAFSGFPTIVPSSVFGKNAPSEKINIGWIGCGRQGTGDVRATIGFDSAMFIHKVRVIRIMST